MADETDNAETPEAPDAAAADTAERAPEAAPEVSEEAAQSAPIGETLGDAIGAAAGKNGAGQTIEAMLNVGLNVQIVLGRTRMPIAQLLKLSRGSIIELDKSIGQPVEVVINDRLVARGDLVKLKDDRIGVSLIEIVKDYVAEV